MTNPAVFNRRLFMQPGQATFEKRAVLNPSIITIDGVHHMHYRAVDPEMISTIGYAQIDYSSGTAEIVNRHPEPVLKPRYEFDKMGVEDPRVVEFEGKYYMFHTAYDGYNAITALVAGDDVVNWEESYRIGPLFTNEEAIKLIPKAASLDHYRETWAKDPADQLLWEKDMSVFPRRINGKIACLHRLRPDMQIAYLDSMDDLKDQAYWEDYLRHMDEFRHMGREQDWEASHMGMGPSPIETSEGWLVIYHGVNMTGAKTYRAGAALLDLDDPQKVIGRTREPLFEPVTDWERVGDVDNVVFPEGLIIHENNLDIFYGGADSMIGVISVKFDELIDFLKTQGA